MPDSRLNPHSVFTAAEHLRAWIAYSGSDSGLFFWRTRSGVEVDFVVYGDGEILAIEVQSSGVVRPGDLRALRSFAEDYPESQPLLLYRGTETLLIDGIRCLPVETFLRSLVPFRPIIRRDARDRTLTHPYDITYDQSPV